jgi:Ribbon-helix-helix protein, copG family
MKSVRLGHELEARVKQAARKEGRTESDLIREAIAEKVDRVLGADVTALLEDFVGVLDSGGMSLARDAHRNAGSVIAEEFDRRRTERSRP